MSARTEKTCPCGAPPRDDAGVDLDAAEQRIAAAWAMVRALNEPRGTAGARAWTMSIPARPDHDPDLVIGAALHTAGVMLDALRAARQRIAALELTTETEKVLQDIAAERARQDAQWGGPEHDDGHTAGEWRWFREKFERRAVAVLGMPVDERRDALVKLAALAVAQIEALDRHRPSLCASTPEPR